MSSGYEQLSGQDLRNRSFRGHALRDADLHGSDLRGADFSGADLRGADLRATRMGLAQPWASFLFAIALGLSLGIGLIAGWAGERLAELVRSDQARARVLGVFLSVELIAFLVVAVVRGIDAAARRVLPVAIGLAALVAILAVATGWGPGTGALMVFAFSALLLVLFVFVTLARAVAATEGAVIFAVVAISGAVAGSVTGGGLYATAIAVAGMLAARRSMAGKGAPRIERVSLAFACRGGTRFRGADLRNAKLDAARVRNADFRSARLTGARFDGARIDFSLLDPGSMKRSASSPHSPGLANKTAGDGGRQPLTRKSRPSPGSSGSRG
jgi:uncharacterized protein YjbI with pentapeptide repeats